LALLHRADIRYLGQLALHPLRTKAITNATLNGVQEVTASYLAGEKTKDGSYISDRVPKMMAYGTVNANMDDTANGSRRVCIGPVEPLPRDNLAEGL
jgi:hypothetical protein